MIHSNYVDEETYDYLIKAFLMKDYHLSLREIDDIPSDLLQFLVLIKNEEIKELKKKKNNIDKRMNRMLKR